MDPAIGLYCTYPVRQNYEPSFELMKLMMSDVFEGLNTMAGVAGRPLNWRSLSIIGTAAGFDVTVAWAGNV